MKVIGNFLGYQAVWFAAVMGAGASLWWPGVLAAVLFAAWQLAISAQRGADLRLMCAAVGAGCLLDGGLAASGMARYAASAPALPPGGAPLWILALWASFALTLNSSLAYLRRRPIAAVMLGAFGGPLAYAGASQGWQAVSFGAPAWHALACLAIGWAFTMPLLAGLARRWSLDPAPGAAPLTEAS
jgi:hypothetical protein